MINIKTCLLLLLLSNLFTLIFVIQRERKKAELTYKYYCGFYEQNKKLFTENALAKMTLQLKEKRIEELKKENERLKGGDIKCK